jgi:hypothetical protein
MQAVMVAEGREELAQVALFCVFLAGDGCGYSSHI